MGNPRQRAKLTRDERAVLRAFAKSVKASVKGIVAASRSARKVAAQDQDANKGADPCGGP